MMIVDVVVEKRRRFHFDHASPYTPAMLMDFNQVAVRQKSINQF